ncbi:AsnC family transcriptional regulator [Maribacter ulvicola]|uniref:Lrp/AsnC family transcriptional regulator, leucine-responsive regulatory protein n=1 Tax=Maribacter ulvicola TaxID=228959 RepID=A0A1N6W9Y7_9FLAO|nr:Lrp/AsnC family transcriptional regulator, leucine-responsive regulatory protein [Maribacter ulvicola]
MPDLDEIDLKLLKLLQQNGKLTTKETAKQVNLSPTFLGLLILYFG